MACMLLLTVNKAAEKRCCGAPAAGAVVEGVKGWMQETLIILLDGDLRIPPLSSLH